MSAIIALYIIINARHNTPLVHFQVDTNVILIVVWRQCLEALTNNYTLQQLDATFNLCKKFKKLKKKKN